MTKFFRLLLFTSTLSILFTINYCFAETRISGIIDENTIWTVDKSPYIIEGFTLFRNTLTIEPGVVVQIAPGVSFIINGDLIAIGTPKDSITFTSQGSDQAKSLWMCIATNFNSAITFDYVNVKNSHEGLKIASTSNNSIKHSLFFNNAYAISSVPGQLAGYLNIDSTTFCHNTEGIAFYLEGNTITNCIFKENGIGATLIKSTTKNCLFIGNTDKGLTGYDSNIENCIFTKNNIGIEQRFNGTTTASIITDNIIKHNQIGLQITGDVPTATFSRNIVCNNSIYNVKNTSLYTTYLPDNCWCTDNEAEISNSIYDGEDDSNVGQVKFSPIASCPINTTPVIKSYDRITSILEDEPLQINIKDLSIEGSEIFLYDLFTVKVLDGENYTVLNNSILPDENFNGQLQIAIIIDDGELKSGPFHLSIDVLPVNDPAIISDYKGVTSINKNQSLEIKLTDFAVSDPDNLFPDEMSLSIIPGNDFTLSGNIITPKENYTGILQISVQVNDGISESDYFIINLNINGTTSIIQSAEEISIYTDPFLKELTIDLKQYNYDNYTIELYNVLGVLIKEKTVNSDWSRQTLDLSFLKSGEYLLRIINKDSIIKNSKLMIF
ncbi:MAG: T9SS type A sorting domain-containing protein [Sporocytophaga sp.]|nr:T9SS type A sorting domain-containing protein [Sporocytophaga sp.]